MDEKVSAPPSRPREMVRSYLESAFLSNGKDQQHLPTISQLAIHLGVSVPTVRTVVRELVAEGRLITTQGRGTFVLQNNLKRTLTIGTNMRVLNSPNHPPNWAESIYLGAVRMAVSMRRNISIMPVGYQQKFTSDEVVQELLAQRQNIDMLMLFPSSRNEKLRKINEEEGRPVVEINPPSVFSTSNFVSANFFRASWNVGKAWRKAGRKRIIYIGSLHEMSSVDLQLLGLSRGCGHYQDSHIRFHALAAEYDGAKEVETERALKKAFYKSDERPDAVYCAGDFQATKVLELLKKWGVSVPDEVSVVSGTGFRGASLSEAGLTRILQPMSEIGANAVRMLCHRLDNQCISMPGVFLDTPIYTGSTTRSDENSLLNTEFEKSAEELNDGQEFPP